MNKTLFNVVILVSCESYANLMHAQKMVF